MNKHIITPDQFMLIQGFMLYVWNVNHGEENGEYFGFWAQQLDEASISWYVQNAAAHEMSVRANGCVYFRSLLKKHNIHIEQPAPEHVISAEYEEDKSIINEKPFVVRLFQDNQQIDQEYYGTETSAMERAEDINRLKTSDRERI